MPPLTHTNLTRRLLIVASHDVAMLDRGQLEDLLEAARGGHVRVVAPARAVRGERWIIDLTAREAQARRRLEGWRGALERHAGLVEAEIGDADARLALADAQREFEPQTVVATVPSAAPAQEMGWTRRWWWQEQQAARVPLAA